MTFGIIMLVIWGIVGIWAMVSKEVPKISYIATWIVLMIQLIDNYLVT